MCHTRLASGTAEVGRWRRAREFREHSQKWLCHEGGLLGSQGTPSPLFSEVRILKGLEREIV